MFGNFSPIHLYRSAPKNASDSVRGELFAMLMHHRFWCRRTSPLLWSTFIRQNHGGAILRLYEQRAVLGTPNFITSPNDFNGGLRWILPPRQGLLRQVGGKKWQTESDYNDKFNKSVMLCFFSCWIIQREIIIMQRDNQKCKRAGWNILLSSDSSCSNGKWEESGDWTQLWGVTESGNRIAAL